jgi:oxaloacetate decarboxylase alpha subunit
MPDGVIAYVLGTFGTPPGPISDDVRDRVAASKRASELSRPKPEPTLADLRQTYGINRSEEELLLRAVLPAAQVDAALSGSSTPA